jgi:hypothetical protein
MQRLVEQFWLGNLATTNCCTKQIRGSPTHPVDNAAELNTDTHTNIYVYIHAKQWLALNEFKDRPQKGIHTEMNCLM